MEDFLEYFEDKHRFDQSTPVTHPMDCSPDTCALVGYLDDGDLRYQEQTGRYPVVDPDTPDWNPRGCSRQCSFTDATYGDERIEQPMVQTGERGSDNWEPIAWEEAYERIADALIDAVEENPQSILTEIPPGEGGLTHGCVPFDFLVGQLGGLVLDGGSLIGDFDVGQYITFGKFNHGPTQDDWFKSELLLIWQGNPAYSRNPAYHFLTESRYHGGEVMTIAPDFSPSCVHADRYVPVEPASDAALALGMARVMIEENRVDTEFVREQTDLPLLVRSDTGRFLRQSDVRDGGSDEHFYMWDEQDGLVQAPRDTLDLGEIQPTLEGTHEVTLQDGKTVEVQPVMVRLTRRLKEDYDLETVREITGVAPEVVRELAEKVARKRTTIVNCFNQCKMFHGDLIVRSMLLVMALGGNWGKPGAGGMEGWTLVREVGGFSRQGGPDPILAQTAQSQADHELHREEVATESARYQNELLNWVVPPVFFWYRQAGFREEWDEASLESAELPRSIPDYFEEAVEKDWWDPVDMPGEDVEPSVALWVAGNPVRRTRGGTRVMVEELWPKLDTIVTVDYRWSATALRSDIVLPAAFIHEKEQFDSMVDMKVRFWSYANQAVQPRHDARSEVRMAGELARTIERRAEERGLETYEVPHGLTVERLNDVLGLSELPESEQFAEIPDEIERMAGRWRRYDDIHDQMTDGGTLVPHNLDAYHREMVEHCEEIGMFQEGETHEAIRQRGFVKYEDPGESQQGLNTTHSVEPDETVPLFTQHVRDKKPFLSVTGRAQFYIDHPWFLEADEHLPRHKSPPSVYGGDRETYPFVVTSGHNRHSTQSSTLANETQANMHRGEPHVFINRTVAEEKGIEDGDFVWVFNDHGSFRVQAKVSSHPRPDQLILYHAWDPYLYPEGVGLHELTPGLIKPLHLAGGYGHLRYYLGAWQPQQVDRHISVDLEAAESTTTD